MHYFFPPSREMTTVFEVLSRLNVKMLVSTVWKTGTNLQSTQVAWSVENGQAFHAGNTREQTVT
jgi:hypothetical protein